MSLSARTLAAARPAHWCLVVVVLAATACVGGNVASGLNTPPALAFDKCSVKSGKTKPLIVEWESAARGDLEVTARRGDREQRARSDRVWNTMVHPHSFRILGLALLIACGGSCSSSPRAPDSVPTTPRIVESDAGEIPVVDGSGGPGTDGVAGPVAVVPRLQPALSDYTARRTQSVATLAETVMTCVQRKDTAHALFRGCIDWHSAVHGHYALLVASRLTGQARFRQVVDDNLTAKGIAAESRWLSEHPDFEMPYGRAWFLRLAIEDARAPGQQRMRTMADQTARSLLVWLSRDNADLDGVDYGDASWALRQLHDYCHLRGDAACLATVERLVQGRMLGSVRQGLKADHDSFTGFFSPWSLRAHLLEVTARPEQFSAWVQASSGESAALEPVGRAQTDHHMGINFSRAWGMFSAYVVVRDPRWLVAALGHVEAGMSRHAELKDDYHAYGHWVPQFGIYAMDTMEPELMQQESKR